MKHVGKQVVKKLMYISETVRALLVSVPISQTAAVAQAPAPTASALLEDKNGGFCM